MEKIICIPGPKSMTFKLQKKPSAQQKTIQTSSFISSLGDNYGLPGSGSANPFESRSNPDPVH